MFARFAKKLFPCIGALHVAASLHQRSVDNLSEICDAEMNAPPAHVRGQFTEQHLITNKGNKNNAT